MADQSPAPTKKASASKPPNRPSNKPTKQAAPAPVAPVSYEEARAELIEVVQALESGGTSLEESLALWERGESLAKACQEWLDGARQRVQQAVDAPAGPTT